MNYLVEGEKNRKYIENIKLFKEELGTLKFSDLLNEFQTSNKKFSFFFPELKEGNLRYYVFGLIGQLISYFDLKGYNRHKWNKYNDLRTVARSGVNQTLWVINLLKYKISKNNINSVSKSIANAISFIVEPKDNLTMLSERHRVMFSEIILKRPYDKSSFNIEVFEFFEQFKITIINSKNRGIIIFIDNAMFYSKLDCIKKLILVIC